MWQAASLLISGMIIGAGLSAVALGEPHSRLISGWSEDELAHYVDQRIEQRLRRAQLTEDQLDDRIDQGILAFIAKQQAQQTVEPIQPDDHVLGDRSARITLIEYADYECPYCRQFHATAHRIVEHYQGKVNWVYRHFPLSIHKPAAETAAVGAECVAKLGGNATFWAYGDRLFQDARFTGGSVSVSELVSLAAEIGLSRTRFKHCLDSGKTLAAVHADITGGERAGVTGTPANFVRDNATGAVIPMMGARPYGQFKQVIDQLLARSAQTSSR
ncbi:MAG TPA: thioredoxin domain-containing protein [Nitrococcus sp.]|nr:thioredoxin domain-containing protein [Nitrococcus sp.]